MQHVNGGAVFAQLVVAGFLVDGSREFEQDGKVVRQFPGGRDYPGGPVHIRKRQQRHPSVPGVARRVVRQEQRATAFPVEDLRVLHGRLDQRQGTQVVDGSQQRRPELEVNAGHRARDEVKPFCLNRIRIGE